jgi:hypothetical protein
MTGLRPPLGFLNRTATYWAIAGALAALTLMAAERRVTPSDLGIYLYAAERLLDGGTLYRDVVEINPPLIVWLNLPAVLLARWTSLPADTAYRLTITALFVFSIWLCGRFVARAVADRVIVRTFLLLLWFALFPLAWIDFGQREHLLLGLVLPYVLLAGARAANRPTRLLERVIAGVMAGVAICLKPHFVVLWLSLEAWVRLRKASGRLTPGAESLATVGLVAAYGITVLAATDYVGVLSVLGPAYATFMNASPTHALLVNPAAPLVLFALFAFAALRRSPPLVVPWSLLATAIASAYAAGVLQHKGFRYHYYPAFAFAMVLVGWMALIARQRTSVSARLYTRLTPLLTATIVLVVLGHAFVEALGWDSRRSREVKGLADLADEVGSRSRGRPVGVLSYSVDGAFPLINEINGSLALRLPSLWPFAASYWDSLLVGGALRYRDVQDMPAAERYMWDVVRQDLTSNPPGVLLVLSAGRDVRGNGLRRLNYLAYFARDPELRRLFDSYQLVDGTGEYHVYERLDPGAPRQGPPPSTEPLPRVAPRLGLGDFTARMIDPTVSIGVGVFLLLWLGTTDRLSLTKWRRSRADARTAGEQPQSP